MGKSKSNSKSVKYQIPQSELDKYKYTNDVLWSEGELEILRQCLDEDGKRIFTYKRISDFLIEYGEGKKRRSNAAIESRIIRMRDLESGASHGKSK